MTACIPRWSSCWNQFTAVGGGVREESPALRALDELATVVSVTLAGRQ